MASLPNRKYHAVVVKKTDKKPRKPNKRKVKVLTKKKSESKVIFLNAPKRDRHSKKKGKFIGFCVKCMTSIMDEDQIGMKVGRSTQLLNKYMCPHCSSMSTRENLDQPIKLIGNWYVVVENVKTVFRVVSRKREDAAEFVKNRSWHSCPVMMMKRYRTIRVKGGDEIAMDRWVRKEGVRDPNYVE